MGKFTLYTVGFWVLAMLLLIIVAIVAGCAALQPRPTVEPVVVPPYQVILWKTLEKTNWLATLAIVGIGTGFYSFLRTGHDRSLHIIAACFVVLATTVMIARYHAIVGFLTLIGGTGLFIYTTFIKDRALKEVVKGVQNHRDNMDNMVYSKHMLDQRLQDAQSKTTEKIIKHIKKKDLLTH